MGKESEDNIKELFANLGLWSLVKDINEDLLDGEDDTLQFTEQGLKAYKMIERLLNERERTVLEEVLDHKSSINFKDGFWGGKFGTHVVNNIVIRLNNINNKKK